MTLADACVLVGVAIVLAGIGYWSVPAAVVTAGVCLIGIGSRRR